MKERPIIFNADMVRAVLDGRKTQTRRIMTPQPTDDIQPHQFPNKSLLGWLSSLKHKHGSFTAHICPFGQPGDRLWVRETWQCTSFETNEYGHVEGVDYMREIPKQKPQSPAWGVSYEANGFNTGDAEERGFPWRPSIHMPHWASRITLEITGVRVERLNSMTEQDAIAEGCCGGHNSIPGYQYSATPHEHFHHVWQSIYGADSWQANPWVWVVEFKRMEVKE